VLRSKKTGRVSTVKLLRAVEETVSGPSVWESATEGLGGTVVGVLQGLSSMACLCTESVMTSKKPAIVSRCNSNSSEEDTSLTLEDLDVIKTVGKKEQGPPMSLPVILSGIKDWGLVGCNNFVGKLKPRWVGLREWDEWNNDGGD